MQPEIDGTSELVESPEVPETTISDGTNEGITQAEEPNEGGHPAWQPILEAVPSSLHGVVKPELENWDKGVQSRFEELNTRYSPYNPFIEQGITAEELEVAHNISRQIDEDPVTFYHRMQEYLMQNGLLEAEQQEESGQVEQTEYDFGDEEVPEYVQQLQQQIATQQQQLQQFYEGINTYAQEQQYQSIQRQAEDELDQELNSLEQKVGELDPVVKRELFTRVSAMQQQSQKAVSLEQAYNSLMGFVSHYNQRPSPGRNAPRVLPTGGGLPAPEPKKPATNEVERKAQAADVIRRMNEN